MPNANLTIILQCNTAVNDHLGDEFLNDVYVDDEFNLRCFPDWPADDDGTADLDERRWRLYHFHCLKGGLFVRIATPCSCCFVFVKVCATVAMSRHFVLRLIRSATSCDAISCCTCSAYINLTCR
jgi:hypothetical protein